MTVSYRPNSTVSLHGRKCRILRAVSTSDVLIEDLQTKAKEVVHISNLTSPEAQPPARPIAPLEAVHEDDLAEARRRLDIIRPLIDDPSNRTQRLAQIAKENLLGTATLWRWLEAYESRNLLSDLAPQRRGRKCSGGGGGRPLTTNLVR